MEVLNSRPRLFLTCMSSGPSAENMVEMIEPLLDAIDGVIWVLHDTPVDSPAARYLETVKGAGEIIHRKKTSRKFHSMNEMLCSRTANDGDFLALCEQSERPAISFLKRVKSEIGPMMEEADVSTILYNKIPYLIKLGAQQQFVQPSPDPESWTLIVGNTRVIDWAAIQPNERDVKTNSKLSGK